VDAVHDPHLFESLRELHADPHQFGAVRRFYVVVDVNVIHEAFATGSVRKVGRPQRRRSLCETTK
jgi:hypothetical protein